MMPKMPSLEDRKRLDYKRTTPNPYNFPDYVPRATFSGEVKPVKEINSNPIGYKAEPKRRLKSIHKIKLIVEGLGEFNYKEFSTRISIPLTTVRRYISKKPFDKEFIVQFRSKEYKIIKSKF